MERFIKGTESSTSLGVGRGSCPRRSSPEPEIWEGWVGQSVGACGHWTCDQPFLDLTMEMFVLLTPKRVASTACL